MVSLSDIEAEIFEAEFEAEQERRAKLLEDYELDQYYQHFGYPPPTAEELAERLNEELKATQKEVELLRERFKDLEMTANSRLATRGNGAQVETTTTPRPDFITIKDIPGVYAAVSEATIRWWIFVNRENFNSRCVSRRGRKVLINRRELEKWLAEREG